jgi:hypothetical protein
MKQLQTISFLFIAVLFAACSPGAEKKIVVMANGKVTVADKTISIEPGMTHTEQEVVFKDEKVTLTVKSSDGTNKTFDLADNGVYMLNLQQDTLIGGPVNYGSAGMPSSITAEQLDHIIDSTKQLMAGQNANDEKKTFFLPPYTIKKISTQSNAKIVGSFKGIPNSVEPDNSGKIPEVYKFFTNKQKRETLNDLLQENEKLKSVH